MIVWAVIGEPTTANARRQDAQRGAAKIEVKAVLGVNGEDGD